MVINEGDKIRLKTGEVARICEVFEVEKAYLAELHDETDYPIDVIDVWRKDISGVFVQNEHCVA